MTTEREDDLTKVLLYLSELSGVPDDVDESAARLNAYLSTFSNDN